VRDVITDLARWWDAGDTVGIGTVVGTWKSSPRQPGAAMLVGPDGTAVGSVSGGCVEGAVYELAETARDGGVPVLQLQAVFACTACEWIRSVAGEAWRQSRRKR